MENQTVNFVIHSYRVLLDEKLKALQSLEQLYEEQNKHIIDKLLEEKILTVVNNQVIPSGIIMNPASQEDMDENQKVSIKINDIFQEYGGKRSVTVILEQLNKMLCFEITPEDINKCLV